MRPSKASQDRRLALRRPVGRRTEDAPLDAIDLKIIDALRANGRESFRRIASDLDISEATVRARFARLGRLNLFRVRGVVNALELGFDAVAMVGVKTEGPPLVVAQQLAAWPETTSVALSAGQFDILVEVACTDRHELLDVASRMRALDGVADTQLSPYLRICKHPQQWEPEPASLTGSRARAESTN